MSAPSATVRTGSIPVRITAPIQARMPTVKGAGRRPFDGPSGGPSDEPDLATDLWTRLMEQAIGQGNDQVYACMIASWQTGAGTMPDWLGLPPAAFRCLLAHHFPGIEMATLNPRGIALPQDREDERNELVRLMLRGKSGESPSEVWMAQVIAAGCMAADHLWQDLGLWSRTDLTALMRRNFPRLAAGNLRDMKWKRFLYKQLCEAEGIYTCRVPSCAECTDYDACFGPEG
jgi:nitrogen fixation protein NifQ